MRTILAMLMMVGTAGAAQPTEEDFKKAIFQLGTAHLCEPIIKDDGPYEWAKQNLIELVGSDRAKELIDVMLKQDRDTDPPTEPFCRSMLKNMGFPG